MNIIELAAAESIDEKMMSTSELAEIDSFYLADCYKLIVVVVDQHIEINLFEIEYIEIADIVVVD